MVNEQIEFGLRELGRLQSAVHPALESPWLVQHHASEREPKDVRECARQPHRPVARLLGSLSAKGIRLEVFLLLQTFSLSSLRAL